ncbi:MAG TPA: lytic transglycosylase domain-containing protein [Nitrospiria bacterium]|nr:lytic transglycosylase domain-containing protein [Nitrospiria bacterium]
MQQLKKWSLPEKLRKPLSLSLLAAGGLALLVLFLAAGGTPESDPQLPPTRPFLSSFRLPQEMQFAGQPVPLDNWQVRERIEYEFYQFLGDEGENIILAKRTGRCFPLVERMLAEAGMPDDLKYVLLVESKCVPAATSSAKAAGPWQFTSSTGRHFDLERTYWKDERRDLERSTEAAIKYLKVLHNLFDDWYLALAAYNAGEKRIRMALRDQKVADYWKVRFNSETMRYIPRILAVKEIFSQPEKFLSLAKEDLYTPVDTERVTVKIAGQRQHLSSLAAEFGSYFLELKLLNPEIRKDFLPGGTHEIRVPRQSIPGCPEGCDNPHAP